MNIGTMWLTAAVNINPFNKGIRSMRSSLSSLSRWTRFTIAGFGLMGAGKRLWRWADTAVEKMKYLDAGAAKSATLFQKLKNEMSGFSNVIGVKLADSFSKVITWLTQINPESEIAIDRISRLSLAYGVLAGSIKLAVEAGKSIGRAWNVSRTWLAGKVAGVQTGLAGAAYQRSKNALGANDPETQRRKAIWEAALQNERFIMSKQLSEAVESFKEPMDDYIKYMEKLVDALMNMDKKGWGSYSDAAADAAKKALEDAKKLKEQERASKIGTWMSGQELWKSNISGSVKSDYDRKMLNAMETTAKATQEIATNTADSGGLL